MSLSRRAFFKRIASRRTLRSLGNLFFQGLGEIGDLADRSVGSVEDAGRALRNVRRKGSLKLTPDGLLARSDGPGGADSAGPAPRSKRGSGTGGENRQACNKASGMQDSTPSDSDGVRVAL